MSPQFSSLKSKSSKESSMKQAANALYWLSTESAASYPRRQKSPQPPLREPQTLRIIHFCFHFFDAETWQTSSEWKLQAFIPSILHIIHIPSVRPSTSQNVDHVRLEFLQFTFCFVGWDLSPLGPFFRSPRFRFLRSPLFQVPYVPISPSTAATLAYCTFPGWYMRVIVE
jgi:hypothetical protein